MSESTHRRGGATATQEPSTKRRPWWVWALLALVAVLIVVAILLLATQCGSSSSSAPGTASSADELGSVPAARVMVLGFAAPVGMSDMPDPQELSDGRATAVAERLGAAGVSSDRLQTRGASDTVPLATAAASRRAELTVS